MDSVGDETDRGQTGKLTGAQKRKARLGVRATGCVTFSWLVGGEVTEQCYQNLELSLKSASSTWVGA